MEGLYGSIISAAASHINSMQNGLLGYLGNYLQAKHSAANAAFQNSMNIENWRMQNAYNTPAAQMERYKQAGINPYLVASQGNAGNAGSLPSYPSIQVPDYASTFQAAAASRLQTLNAIMNMLSTQKDIQLKDHAIQKTDAETDSIKQNTTNSLWEYTNLYPLRKNKMSNEVEKLGNEIILLSLQSKGAEIMNDINKFQRDYILPLSRTNLGYRNDLLKYQRDFLNPAQRALLWANVANTKANTKFTNLKSEHQEMDNIWQPAYLAQGFTKEKKQLDLLDLASYNAQEELYRNILHNVTYEDYGTDQPGNVKFGPFPFGVWTWKNFNRNARKRHNQYFNNYGLKTY